ncbi:hypothetical protein G6F56_004676 [Rhizopus delemar]|nr:hypothetical protein G6F56_004676 [Rhizopus delemar]
MNYSLNSLQLIHLDKAVDSENQCNVFKTSAKDAIPIYATRDKHIDLLILDVENNIRLLIDVSLHAITKIQLHFPATPTRLLHPVHDRLTVQYDNGQTIRYMLNLRPQSPLVRDCLIAIDCGSTISFPKIWIRFLELHFLSALETNMSEWASFTIALFSFLKIKRYEPWGREYEYKESTEKPIPAVWIERAIKENKGPNSLSMAALVEIIYTLHVVYEDYRIKKTTIHHARILGYLLLQLSVNLKNEEWIYYYKNQGFDTNLVHSLDIMKGETKVAISKPLDFQTCLRRMINSTLSEPVMNGFHGVHALKPAFLHYTDTYARTVKKLLSIYSVMKDMASNGKAIVNSIVDEGVTIEDIRMMYDVVASPILEVLDSLRTNPSLGWRVEAYRLIERNDVYKQLEIERKECDPNTDSFKLAFFEDSENRMDIGDIKMNQEIDQKHIYESDILNKKIAQLRFGLDKSIEKVRVMLDSTKAPDRYVTETPDLSDNDLAEKHQREVLMVTGRTITLSLGRCIYAFGTYIPDLTRDLPLEDMVFSAKIQPLRTIVQLDEEHITDEVLLWPKFHTGVAAGIRISPSNEVNESWINFCFPKSIEVEHGGILLGMGLTGVLKKLPVEYWYRFITSKCEQVMIGFILGACVNYIGTKQLNVTKILFIYIPSCVPGNDDAFEYSNQTIACNILGMGLVYMKSCDRSMLSIMFQELSRNAYSNASSFNSDYGSVSLAAGFAIGFIALGAGDQANLENLNLKSKLYKFLSARDNNYPKPPSPAHEHGATLALGLIYLKTENKKVADHLEVLETKHYLTLIRPDLMLIRVVAKNLIMWSTIEPTENWIDRQVPSFLLEPKDDIHEETAKQAMYSIIAGASLCIGLRFAGSKDDRAIQVILSRLNVFMRLAKASDATPSQKTTKSAIRTCINVLCTSAAMIAAGSGNPKVLRPLQELYDTLTPTTYYGSHMAISMSLGLLFVGLGGYTLKITDQAIAGLLCAFYPFYPIHSQDNDWHPQVFRHLWVIAADPRWVIPLDVDLNEPCSVPMQLEMYDGDKVHQIRIEAPAVLPDHSLIKSIQISDHRYWPLHVEEESVEYRDSIINSGVIYVKRKNSAPGDLVDFDF